MLVPPEQTVCFLAVDMGNSDLKLAFMQGTVLFHTWREPVANLTSDWLERYIQILKRVSDTLKSQHAGRAICSVIISSVLPAEQTIAFKTCVKTVLQLPEQAVWSVHNTIKQSFVDFSGYAPRQLGMDRLVGVIATSVLYPGTPLIVVDCGTATTVDILQGNNTYLGGAILPGWATFTGSLSLKTPLPVIQPSQFVHWQPNPGNNTQTSLMAGYSIGYQGAILALLNWAISSLSLEASQLPQLVFTGGLATCVLQLCQQHTGYPVSNQGTTLLQECLQKTQIKEHLVFYGLACLHAVITKDRPEAAEPDFSKKFQ